MKRRAQTIKLTAGYSQMFHTRTHTHTDLLSGHWLLKEVEVPPSVKRLHLPSLQSLWQVTLVLSSSASLSLFSKE